MMEQEQFSALPRMELRGESWTRRTLSDAWESTNWEGLCGTPWQMVAPELKLTKKVTADAEGAGPPLPRIVVERSPEVDGKSKDECVQRQNRRARASQREEKSSS